MPFHVDSKNENKCTSENKPVLDVSTYLMHQIFTAFSPSYNKNNRLTAYKLVTESQLTAVCWTYTGLVDTAYDYMVKEASLIPSQHKTSKQLERKVLKSLRRAIYSRNHSFIGIKYEK